MKNPWKIMQWLAKANMDSWSENLLTYDKDSEWREGSRQVFFYFSKDFDTISQNIFIEKVSSV